MSLREWAEAHDTSEDANCRWANDYHSKVYREIQTCHTPLMWRFGFDVERDLGWVTTRHLGKHDNPRGDGPDRLTIGASFGPFHLTYTRERAAA